MRSDQIRSNWKEEQGVFMTDEGGEKSIATAIDVIKNYILEITGETATDTEIAGALTRYFVLREICEHIEMQRGNGDSS